MYETYYVFKDIYQHINKEQILIMISNKNNTWSNNITVNLIYKDFKDKMLNVLETNNFIEIDENYNARLYDGIIQFSNLKNNVMYNIKKDDMIQYFAEN